MNFGIFGKLGLHPNRGLKPLWKEVCEVVRRGGVLFGSYRHPAADFATGVGNAVKE